MLGTALLAGDRLSNSPYKYNNALKPAVLDSRVEGKTQDYINKKVPITLYTERRILPDGTIEFTGGVKVGDKIYGKVPKGLDDKPTKEIKNTY